jgi:hypothetical protein
MEEQILAVRSRDYSNRRIHPTRKKAPNRARTQTSSPSLTMQKMHAEAKRHMQMHHIFVAAL